MSDLKTWVDLSTKKGWIGVGVAMVGIGAIVIRSPEAELDKLLKYWFLPFLPLFLWSFYNIGASIEKFLSSYVSGQEKIAEVGTKLDDRLKNIGDQMEAFAQRLEKVEDALQRFYLVIEKRRTQDGHSGDTEKFLNVRK